MVTSYTDQVERVEWMDASSRADWLDTSNLPGTIAVVSIGWLSYEGDDYICISASHYNTDGVDMWGDTIAIPKGMVVSRKQLEI